MMNQLSSHQIIETHFMVVDFETVTPKGRPPEPLELAAMLIAPGFALDPSFRFSQLILPPDGAPLTAFDTQQTGIRPLDIADAPDAATVLQEFDEHLVSEYLVLVAHNARYEAAIFQRFAPHCPRTVALPFLDTVALGKYLVPGLPNYKLDTLAQHFRLIIPAQRHRALPDVELTAQVLMQLLHLQREQSPHCTVSDLLCIAGIKPKETPEEPVQISLW